MRIRVETSSGMPITRQIAAQIRAQCASGVLQPGERLPSVRVLAAELAVNQNTILRVYERLTAQWILYCGHLQGSYPYIFSIVSRTHPLQERPDPVVH